MAEQSTVPKDPALEAAPSGAPDSTEVAGEGEQSKKGAKKAAAKAAKEAEKARKAAEREAAAKASGGPGGGEDLAKANYGDSKVKQAGASTEKEVWLENLKEEHIGKTVKVRAFLQNSRMQGAKMVFVELRDGRSSVQGVLAANAEGQPVSKQMVKWAGGVKLESYVRVEAKVEATKEPVKSCTISGLELHIQKFYVEAGAPEMLNLPFGTAARGAVGGVEEDDDLTKATAGALFLSF